MRIVVNGWFAGQLGTGTGQYLAALQKWLPGLGTEHEWVVVRQGSSITRPMATARKAGVRNQTSNVKRQTGTAGSAGVSAQTSPGDCPQGGRSQLDVNGQTTSGDCALSGREQSNVKGPTETVRDQTSEGQGWRVVCADTPVGWAGHDLGKVWWEQVTFPRVCRKVAADVALVPYWGSPWRAPCPVVVTIHDLIPLLLPAYRGGPAQRAYTWLVGRTARRACAILTDSESSRQDIIRHLRVPPERVHAVYLSVDEGLNPVQDPGKLARVRERYRLPEGPFWLYFGGFDVRKNVRGLLEAYAQLRDRRGTELVPPLVIAGRLPAGDSAFAPDPAKTVIRLGIGESVLFAGWVDESDKAAVYSLASAAFFLSQYEGFGLPVLEAQACGCPVVTSA